jgi:hypothetical protein
MSKENSLKNLLGLSKKKAPPGGEDKEEEVEEEEEEEEEEEQQQQQQQQQHTARASEPTLDAKQRWHRRGNKTRNRTGASGEGEGVLETKERWNRRGNRSGARGEEEGGLKVTKRMGNPVLFRWKDMKSLSQQDSRIQLRTFPPPCW